MRTLAILGFLLLATASRVKNPTMDQLALIDSSQFGSDVLDTIQVQLDSGASFDAIIEELDKLADSMHGEQAEDDRNNATRQNECDTAMEEFDNRINTANSEINEATQQLATLNPQLEQTRTDYDTKVTEIDVLNTDIANLKAAHSRDTTSYADRIAEHNAAIAAIDEAIAEMSKLIGSEAGEGIHENSERISAEVLAQVESLTGLKADQDAVQQIIDLLEDIKANLEASVSDEGNTNTVAIDDYDTLLAAMEHTLNDLIVAKTTLEEEKIRLEGEIGTWEQHKATYEDDLAIATAEKDAKIVQCNEWSNKYINDTAKRTEELDIVAQCKDIFTNQNDQMTTYLSDRVES